MASNVKWHGRRVKAKVQRGLDSNMRYAAEYLASDIRVNFPASGQAGTRSGGGDKANPSAPGEIPHIQTGYLRRNIGVERRRASAYRVGTGVGNKESVGYALALEKGTRNMAARPYLRPGLKRNRTKLRRISTRKVI